MSNNKEWRRGGTEDPASQPPRLNAAQMLRMSRLLDEILELDEAGRLDWLAALGPEHQDIAEALRDALSSGRSQPGEALRTLPKFDAHVHGGRDAITSGLTAGTRVGPYELIRSLGSGGMAEVWLARRADGAFRREVALKLPLRTPLRGDLALRFAREREIVARLNHPNIARLFDAGFSRDGQPYLALELVVGKAFDKHCDERRLSIRARLELFQQVLTVVQYAHSNLVLHRDLKPSNILVTEDGQVRLLDFGIAKILSEGEARETELTRLSGRALTLDYASPEQITGASITTAADVYSLGVIFYEVLTGVRPYRMKRTSPAALEEAILQTEPASPSHVAHSMGSVQDRATTIRKLSRDLKGDLDTIALKALKKSPAERYATAAAFSEDIARYLRGDVVLAQRDTLIYRSAKFARRHWVAIGVVGGMVLALAAGFVATSYEAMVASRQRDVALDAQLRSLTQTAAARLKDGDTSGAMSIILSVLTAHAAQGASPAAVSVFQTARATDSALLSLTGHRERVYGAAFSPDGRYLVTASGDHSACIWEVATGRLLRQLLGHTGRVLFAAFSADGQRVATASDDKTARIWDVATGSVLAELEGHEGSVNSAVFSADGLRLLTASSDKTARLWDLSTRQEIRRFSGHSLSVNRADFSPDEKRIVTASRDFTARIWDTESGQERMVLNGHTNMVLSAVFSPDGRWIITASFDKTARLWDAATGLPVRELSRHSGRLWSAAFSPDGSRIVTASSDNKAQVWDAATGSQIGSLSGHKDIVTSASFSRDGLYIVTTSADRTARIWEATPKQQIAALTGHSNAVNAARFSHDGRRIVSASSDRSVRIWDVASRREVLRFGYSQDIYSIALSPDDGHLVIASVDGTARIFTATGREIMQLKGHAAAVASAKFSADGQRVVTAAFDNTARIWDVATGRELRTLRGHTDRLICAAFSPDGRRIVTSSYDKTARVWDAESGKEIMVLNGHQDMVEMAVFSPDGKRIATASKDRTVRLWDALTGRQIMLLGGHTDLVDAVAFSPDGRSVVTGSGDKIARIFDAVSGQQRLALAGHTDLVQSAEFSPDGSSVVTASDDGSVRLWEVRAPPLATQISWADAAQFDPLSSSERFELGLGAPSGVRRWSDTRSPCDVAAAAPYDPDRRAPGVMLDQIVPDLALTACVTEKASYQYGRALAASGRLAEAKGVFEQALAAGHRAAGIDLALLLSRPADGLAEMPRALELLTQAWKDGVAIAAYELGTLYERDLTADTAKAWTWYQKGANAGEPNALARFASFYDGNNPNLLEAFKYYAAASLRARNEDWPDDAWRSWRYRRASLARLIARRGQMQQVADAYQAVLSQGISAPRVVDISIARHGG